ncbi:MAG: hypothetical protein M3Y41_02460 [Pseudomonadota bacterium]|nr:hypothetical protein [Pseudomonadota bacterium]
MAPWTPDTARARAREALAANHQGEDPAAKKREIRAAVTVKELIDTYLLDGLATKRAKRPSTWTNDRCNPRCHIEPLSLFLGGVRTAAAAPSRPHCIAGFTVSADLYTRNPKVDPPAVEAPRQSSPHARVRRRRG